MRVGVFALQGAFKEHVQVLESLGARTLEIRLPEHLHGCDGLVLPGGETTTQRKLALAHGLWEPLGRLGRQGLPILATCAGLILLARRIDDREGHSLGLLEVDVQRNAYGRQVHSFQASLAVSCPERDVHDPAPFPAIFIRAPRIVRVEKGVSVLAAHRGEPVAVEQGNIFGLAFHPELTQDDRFHRYFLERVARRDPSDTGHTNDLEWAGKIKVAAGAEF